MLFPCLFLWPCSYLQDKEKVSNQSYKKACGDKRNRTRADTSTTLSTAKVSHISRVELGLILWRKPENPSAQFKNKPVESYFFKIKTRRLGGLLLHGLYRA
ncbi:hypothetical protein EV2_007538 [Malus domestica]